MASDARLGASSPNLPVDRLGKRCGLMRGLRYIMQSNRGREARDASSLHGIKYAIPAPSDDDDDDEEEETVEEETE